MLTHMFGVLAAILADLIDTGNQLDGASIGLYKQGTVQGGATVLADINEADFEGYARIPVSSWVGPASRAGGLPFVVSDDVAFQADDPLVTENEIAGWFLVKSTTLIAMGKFDENVIVNRAGQLVLVRAEYGPNQNTEGGNQVVSP